MKKTIVGNIYKNDTGLYYKVLDVTDNGGIFMLKGIMRKGKLVLTLSSSDVFLEKKYVKNITNMELVDTVQVSPKELSIAKRQNKINDDYINKCTKLSDELDAIYPKK